MFTLSSIPTTAETIAPAAEPVSLTEAKKHLEIAGSDTAHDTQIANLIEAARRKWEHDTQQFLIQRTMRVKLPYLCELQFPHRPVSSVTSIQYYDSGNSSQTLASSVYDLDSDRSQIRLAYLQTFPATSVRWDAATITYVLGDHSDSTTVPEISKSAMKLLIGFYFENRDMLAPENMQSTKPYEALVMNFMRSSYP